MYRVFYLRRCGIYSAALLASASSTLLLINVAVATGTVGTSALFSLAVPTMLAIAAMLLFAPITAALASVEALSIMPPAARAVVATTIGVATGVVFFALYMIAAAAATTLALTLTGVYLTAQVRRHRVMVLAA